MADITEQLTHAAMRGIISHEDFDKALDLHLRVCRQITCPISGNVMDSRRTALLRIRTDHGDHLMVVDESVPEELITERLEAAGYTLAERWHGGAIITKAMTG